MKNLFITLLFCGFAFGLSGCAKTKQSLAKSLQQKPAPQVQVKVVENGESKTSPDACRGIIVGPGVNQPDPFPGYAGFVGWDTPIKLKNGTWLVGFNAGYWHASPPTPLHYSPKTIDDYRKMGMPDVVAPTGGRAMITRSFDQGKTWSKPETLIDTPADDRHPAFVELRDGTVLACFFTYIGEPKDGDWAKDPEAAVRVLFIRSFDGGKTWVSRSPEESAIGKFRLPA